MKIAVLFLTSLFTLNNTQAAIQPGLATPSTLRRLIERVQSGEVTKTQIQKAASRVNVFTQSKNKTSLTVTEIADQYIQDHMKIDPFYAFYFGTGDLSQLGNDLAAETRAKYIAQFKGVLKQLSKINPSRLSEYEKDTYYLLKNEVSFGIRELSLPFYRLALNSWSGVRIVDYLSSARDGFPFETLSDYEAYLNRADQLSVWVDTAIAILNEGIKTGMVQNRHLAEESLKYMETANIARFDESNFAIPVSKFPKTISLEDQNFLTEKFRVVYLATVLPQVRRLISFYKNTYLPETTLKSGLQAYGAIGRKMYAHRLAMFSDTKISAAEVHALGLKEVAKTAAGLESVKNKMGFKGTLPEFLKFMATSDDSYFKSREEMLRAFNDLRKEINDKIPQYFNKIPETDYVIEEIPETLAMSSPSGSYSAPTENNPIGTFMLNSYNLKSTPIYGVRPLSIHEAAPGHHFQLAIAFELSDELGFYRSCCSGTNAFVEGWAHYAELLGNEMGLYPTDMDQLGFYSDQMLRAVRLVVDSGIHAYGWDFDKVVKYMQTYLPNDISDIVSEANRYAMWPGQATGYKIGQLQIISLREQMRKAQGNSFDMRKFHDTVISSGSLSLDALRRKFSSSR